MKVKSLSLGAALLILAAVNEVRADAPGALDYCFTPTNGTTTCYATRGEAEAALRASTPIGAYMYLAESATTSNPLRLSLRYTADKQEPESHGEPGVQVAGWLASQLGCTPSTNPPGPGPEFCQSESEAISLWIARRAQNLSENNCQYLRHEVVGTNGVPGSISGTQTSPPPRSGAANYSSNALQPERRHLAESWWCPGWGDDEPLETMTGIFTKVPFTCPSGFGVVGPVEDWPRVCRPLHPDLYISVRIRQAQPECPLANNGCDPSSGEKQQPETDFEFAGRPFTRTYRSAGQFESGAAGAGWSHSFSSYVGRYNNNSLRFLVDAHGSYMKIVKVGTTEGGDALRAQGATEYPGRVTSYVYEFRDPDGLVWVYSKANGRLLQRVDPSDARRTITFEYDADGRLARAVDGQQRALTFAYRSIRAEVAQVFTSPGYRMTTVLSTITLPDGQVYTYDYDGYARLTEVTSPDGKTKRYHYNESAQTPPSELALLTGITDENGVRVATFTYDAYERVKSASYAGGVNQTGVSYVSANEVDVQKPGGGVDRYTLGTDVARRPTRIENALGVRTWQYDTSGRVTVFTDQAGVVTRYAYTLGLLTTLTEAQGTSVERVTVHTRDGMGRITRTVVNKRVSGALVAVAESRLAYDSAGRLLARCDAAPGLVFDCANDLTLPAGVRRTVYAYSSGRLVSVDGPRTDVADVTTLAYHASDAAGCATVGAPCAYRAGDLASVTNAMGHRTEFVRYDAAGRLLESVDPNGLATVRTYDARGRLEAVVEGTRITNFGYTDTGLLAWVDVDGDRYLSYEYDDAQRLVAVEDAMGHRIEYALDAAGNPYREEVRDPAGILRRKLSRLFDAFGRLETVADANDEATGFAYDPVGNVSDVTDPLGRVSESSHDPLRRLVASIANAGGTGSERAVSGFEYDPLDRLTAVVDPKGLRTEYGFNALGDLLSLSSPDTGLTEYGYDGAGNRVFQRDARGVETTFGYDVLNRLVSVDVPGTGQDVSYTYDQAPAACATGERHAQGRLGTLADASGTTQYCYDAQGRLVHKVQSVSGGPTHALRYGYTGAGRLASVTYPSGATVTYTRDPAGRVSGVSYVPAGGGSPVTLVASASYLPFGPLQQLVFGNGRSLTKAYDLNYGIAAIVDSGAGGLELGFALDPVGNVVGLEERLAAGTTATRAIDYDDLDRLAALRDGGATVQAFDYDATGNRQSKTSGGATEIYGYPADSHRLTSVGATARSYDAAGNMISDGAKVFIYDDHGRLVEYRADGTTTTRTYHYNGRGERVAKRDPSGGTSDVYFVYDDAGHLLGEYHASGAAVREYVWLDDIPVAVLGDYAGQPFQYLLTDHLGTPRQAVHPVTHATLWRWDLSPTAFGEHAHDNDPDGDGLAYDLRLRYPGQFYDAESGLHYNYFRDYDAATGSYIQSDPIGLAAGPSTFSYVNSSPLTGVDPFGLYVWRNATVRFAQVPPVGRGRLRLPVGRVAGIVIEINDCLNGELISMSIQAADADFELFANLAGTSFRMDIDDGASGRDFRNLTSEGVTFRAQVKDGKATGTLRVGSGFGSFAGQPFAGDDGSYRMENAPSIRSAFPADAGACGDNSSGGCK